MVTTTQFLTYAQWAGIATLVMAGLTGLSFVFGWGLRFRLVGVTGFMGVLTGGLFALSLVPFTHTAIPGAARYARVYDTGAAQVVITVPATIPPDQLEATLQQAAGDLFSPGRMGRGQSQLTIHARTIIHPEPGVSEPLVLGEVRRSLTQRDDPAMQITLRPESLDRLAQFRATLAS